MSLTTSRRGVPADVVTTPVRSRGRAYRWSPARPRVAAGCARQDRMSVLALAGMGLGVCLAVVGLGVLASAGSAAVPARTEVVRVQDGESLSEIAERVAPGSDNAAVVERIRELNGGTVGRLRPGLPLWVPVEK